MPWSRFRDGTAELGYRVAQHVAGRGVATAAVRELCRLAVARHGLRRLRAATPHNNAASQRVLTKAGFVPVGPADPADLGGKPGVLCHPIEAFDNEPSHFGFCDSEPTRAG
jgi:ribosomal-protein-alanine N-acetyltransferase